MVIYLVILIFSMVCAYFYRNDDYGKQCTHICYKGKILKSFPYNKRNFISALGMFLPLFLLSACRYGIGTDYFYTYVPIFESIRWGYDGFSEVGFNLLAESVTVFTTDYQGLFVITSLLTIGLVVLSICRESKNTILSIFIYFMGTYYFFGYSGVRQSLAIAIFLYAIKYIKERKLIKYLLCIGIAMSMHYGAAMYFPMYFLARIKVYPAIRTIVIIAIVLLSSVAGEIFRTIMALTVYGLYLDSSFDTGETSVLLYLVNIGTLALGLIYARKKNDIDNKLYINLLSMSVIIMACSTTIPLAGRISSYFFFSNLLAVPCFLNCIENKRFRWFVTALVCMAYTVYWIYNIVIIKSFEVIPYQSI